MLIAGRFLNGICVGVTSAQVPVYLAEISKHKKRGAIIVIQQLAIEWGIVSLSQNKPVCRERFETCLAYNSCRSPNRDRSKFWPRLSLLCTLSVMIAAP